MSATYRAHAFIGVKLNKSFLWREQTIKGCPHDNPPERKFCPECGNQAWVRDKERVDGADAFDWDRPFYGLRLVPSADEKEVFATLDPLLLTARKVLSTMHLGIHGSDVEQARAQLVNVLQPLGLWIEGEFGVWLVSDFR